MKKIQIHLFEIADYALISRDNKLSVLGIFDRIYVQKIPANHPNMVIVGILNGEPKKKYTAKLSIVTSSGRTIIPELELKGEFGDNGRSNILATLSGMPIPEVGVYKLLCVVDGELIGEREFSVIMVGGQNGWSDDKKNAKLPN